MKICAVIPTFNRKDLLKECINSLLRQTRKLDEIIIIDNASTDGTRAMIASNFPSITYVRLPENTGSSGGFNYGINYAMSKNFDWIWVNDDDSEVYENTLKIMLESSKFLSEVSVLSPLKKDSDGTLLINKHFGFFDYSNFSYKKNGLNEKDLKKKFIEINLTSFTGMFINCLAIKQVGLPTDQLFTQREDNDYCFRLRKYGKIYLISESIILHKEKSSYITVKRFGRKFRRSQLSILWKEYYGLRNILFLFKNKSFPKWRYLSFVWYLIKTTTAIILLDKHSLIRLKYYYLGLYDGLRGHFGKTVDPKSFNLKYEHLFK